MADPQVSGAAHELAAQRWGAQRPIKLARELTARIDELPPAERQQLLDALTILEERRRHE